MSRVERMARQVRRYGFDDPRHRIMCSSKPQRTQLGKATVWLGSIIPVWSSDYYVRWIFLLRWDVIGPMGVDAKRLPLSSNQAGRLLTFDGFDETRRSLGRQKCYYFFTCVFVKSTYFSVRSYYPIEIRLNVRKRFI